VAKKKKAVRTRRRERKNIAIGHAHVLATFNNTIVSLTDRVGLGGRARIQGFAQEHAIRGAGDS
jgi:ribosomal protein S11